MAVSVIGAFIPLAYPYESIDHSNQAMLTLLYPEQSASAERCYGTLLKAVTCSDRC